MFAENALPIKKEAELHEPLVDEGERVEQRPEQRGAHAVTPFENDVDGELLEIFSALTHEENVEFRMSNFECAEFARHDCRRR